MKRIWALILAAALMPSLAACGSGAMSEEKMLENAEACDFAAIQAAYDDNSVNAEETYCGQVYRFAGYVEQIDETSAKVIPLNAPIGISGAYDLAVDVTLPAEDIRELSTFEVVNLVGEISALDAGTVHMETAYYVDDHITFTGTVEGFALNSGFRQTTIDSDMEIIGDDGVTFRYTYLGDSVDLGEPGAFDTFEQETIQGVTLLEGDTVTITGKLTYEITTYMDLGGGIQAYTREFSLTDVESVEKQ